MEEDITAVDITVVMVEEVILADTMAGTRGIILIIMAIIIQDMEIIMVDTMPIMDGAVVIMVQGWAMVLV